MKVKLLNLYKNKRELTILQGLYLTVSILTLVIAGLLALIDQSIGIAVLIAPLITITVFCTNTVVWALTRFVLESLASKPKVQDKKPAK